MYATKRFLSIALAFIVVFGSISPHNVNANSSISSVDQTIKKVINEYFEARYQSINKLKLNDFSALIVDSSVNSKMHKELEKLDLEIYHADLFQLKYLSYKIYLDFGEVKIDLANKSATVEVVEGCDVVFEISSPTISKIGNIHHQIDLVNEKGNWKISSDNYNDFLWQTLKSTNLSLADFRNGISDAKRHLADSQPVSTINEKAAAVTGSYQIESYNGFGAASYADQWWNSYNLAHYYNFSNSGGDCTNFVSQAMHEGGGAPMEPAYWYYVDLTHRGPAWTGVPQLYYFLVSHSADYNNGPVGFLTTADALYFGDIIQYDFTADGAWDHSVIVDGVQSNGIPEIASHGSGNTSGTPNLQLVPYTYWMYSQPNEQIRFIHIGYVKYAQ
jgi:hypothetical protein